MAAKQKRSRCLVTLLHILHVCVSIGLVIAVVRNQLVNESRFEKIERKKECKCYSEGTQGQEVRKSFEFMDGKNISYTKGNSTTVQSLVRRTVSHQLSHDYRSQSGVEYSYNRSGNFNQSINNTNLEKENVKTTIDTMVSTNTKILNHSSEKNNTNRNISSSEYEMIAKILGKEKLQLLSCLDKLKVILNSQIAGDKTDTKRKGRCKLLQGLKGDPGEKGERGAKGDLGPKGCSWTSFAAPSFQLNPQYLVFNEGDPAVLSCNATANPSAHITWYRDNVMLVGERDNASHRYLIRDHDVTSPASLRAQTCPSETPHPVTQSTLLIKQSRSSDTGTYVCKARNILGVYNYEIQILVQVYTHFTKIPANKTITQGDDAQLICRAAGVPTPSITWYRKDGGLMPRHYNITGGDLSIFAISKEEEGPFVCLATNVLGPKTTEAIITVNVFPNITSFLDQPITVNESQTLILPCNATGYPIPEISWYKINDSLPERRYVYGSQKLNISGVKYEDRGEYVCTANNTVGAAVKKTTVIVQVAPKLVKIPKVTEFGYRGRTKRFSFRVFSFPKANIIWKKPYWNKGSEGKFRQENGDLIIENVQYTDSGRYQATARNILGEVKATTFLAVRDAIPPFLTTKPIKEVMIFSTGQTVSLTCTAVGLPIPKVTWTNPDGNVVTSGVTGSDGSRTISIGYFTPEQRGRYTCSAKNDFGVTEAHVYLIINSDIRLAESSPNPYQGRVEVRKGSTWGTVCNRDWDLKHARIACRQLGFKNATSAFTSSRTGQAPGTVYRFICRGNEKRLQDCNTGSTYTTYYSYGSYRRNYICTQNVDAKVKCN